MTTANTALATEEDTNNLKKLINLPSVKAEFTKALPQHLSADRFIRVATTALLRTPSLAECNKESFMKCLMELSAWGIEPDGRRAHLIPFKRRYKDAGGSWRETLDCTLILDWKGICELALRSGFITKLHADIICENDSFGFNLGEIEEHRVDFKKPRGAPYAAYARAVTKDGETFVAVMTKDEILAIRDESQGWKAFVAKFAKQSPWDPENPGSEQEMWKKTVFRRLSKWLPLSAEFRDAIDSDDDSQFPHFRDVTPKEEGRNPTTTPTLKNAFASNSPAELPAGQETASGSTETTAESHQEESPEDRSEEAPAGDERSSGEVLDCIRSVFNRPDLQIEKILKKEKILTSSQMFNGNLPMEKLMEIEDGAESLVAKNTVEG